jgi:hypothetical protein
MSDAEIFEADGVVNKVGSKRVGKRTYYNFTLEDDDTLYMTKTDRPPIEEGDIVEFTYEDGEYGCQVDLDTLEVVGNEEPKPKRRKKSSSKKKSRTSRGRSSREVTKKKSTRASSGGMSKDDYWKRKEATDITKDRRIALAGAYNTALDILSKELELGLLTIPGGNKKAAKLEAFEELLDAKAKELWAKLIRAENEDPLAAFKSDDTDMDDDDSDYEGDEDEDEDGDFDD